MYIDSIFRFAAGYVFTAVFGLFLETPKDATYDDVNKPLLKCYFTIPSIFSLVRVFCFVFWLKFDSPFYYLSNDRREEAEELINQIYYEKYHEEIMQNYQTQLAKKNRKIKLTSPLYRIRFFLAMFLNMMYQFNG